MLLGKKKSPKHIAFDIGDISTWARMNAKEIEQALETSNKRIIETIHNCIQEKIVIFTFNYSYIEVEHFSSHMDAIVELLNNLAKNPLIHENQVKISVIGKWYDLPSKVVDSVKNALQETSDYDSNFLNLCLNYDGREEILDALRVIVRSLQYEKISPDQITKQSLKDNLYSSYFIPPEKIIFFNRKSTHGFLLWDSADAELYFSDKDWCDFDKKAFKNSLS